MGLPTFIDRYIHSGAHTVDDYFAKFLGLIQQADLSIFHKFVPPPSGGGHQFLRTFWQECINFGLTLENNAISRTTRSCLLNSFNFDTHRLRRLHRCSVLYVHRVDGPIDTYRGSNDGIDRKISEINREFADKTIFQSHYSLEKHQSLGMEFCNPVIIHNAINESIFNSKNRLPFAQNRKIRLIASSWSDNPNKGSSVYTWLDTHLDWNRFEFTFVGRSPVEFNNIKMIAPVTPDRMANYFRQSDIYLTASKFDPCSNSLIEALGCGIPAIFLKSGGHPELVGDAGLGFDFAEEIPQLLHQVVDQYKVFQSNIRIPSIQSTTLQYLDVLELR